MASWISCICGNRLHTNLFSAAKVFRLIRDDEWDALGESPDWHDVSLAFLNGREVFRCAKCSRLIVFWERGGPPMYYVENMPNDP